MEMRVLPSGRMRVPRTPTHYRVPALRATGFPSDWRPERITTLAVEDCSHPNGQPVADGKTHDITTLTSNVERSRFP